MLKIVGTDLARVAVKALRNPTFEAKPGYCERFVRQVFAYLYGAEEPYQLFGSSAVSTMSNFAGTVYDVWNMTGKVVPVHQAEPFIMAGDFLYKGTATSGKFGHVGIAFHNVTVDGPALCIAENSTYHMDQSHDGNVSGAKGFRTLQEFGPFEMIVRLSEGV